MKIAKRMSRLCENGVGAQHAAPLRKITRFEQEPIVYPEMSMTCWQIYKICGFKGYQYNQGNASLPYKWQTPSS